MAITYRYIDIFNMIRGSLGMSEEDNKAVAICNMMNEKIWNSYNWRQSLAILPPFGLVPQQQYYGAPEVAVPPDFQGFNQAFLARPTVIPVQKFELHTRRDLRETHIRNYPTYISYDGATQAFKLDRPAPDNTSGHEWIIIGEYKKNPTKVTSSLFGTQLLPYDDRHLSTMVTVMRWAAGVAQGSKDVADRELLAIRSINDMAAAEGFEMGDPNIAPESSLVPGFSNTLIPGVFPWI